MKNVVIAILIVLSVIFSVSCDDSDDYWNEENSGVQVSDFTVTAGTYSWDEDIDVAVSSAYGSNYRVADWEDLENLGSNISDLINRLGLSEGESLFVTNYGSHFYTSTRRYFMSYHNHSKPDNYMAHDNIDNYYVSLGSWDSTLRVLLVAINSTSSDGSYSTGAVSGYVIDSTTGNGIDGVSIYDVADSSYSTTSNSSGYYYFTVLTGSRTLRFNKSGYTFSDVSVTVESGETTAISSNNTVGNPDLGSADLRFVLTWGSSPSDLDSHLITPSGAHVYYADRSPVGAGAYLDVDDTSSYGPETITITSQTSGTYKFYIHQFSDSGYLTSSSAVVKIYDSSGLIRTVNVPTYGSGRYWHVCNIYGSSITVYNDIVSTAP